MDKKWNVKFLISELTNQLTPWSRVVLKKLTVPQLAKKLSPFYGPQSITTQSTTALSWARLIRYTPSHLISWRSILICPPSTPRSTKLPPSFRCPNHIYICPHNCHVSHSSLFWSLEHHLVKSRTREDPQGTHFSSSSSPLFEPNAAIVTRFSNFGVMSPLSVTDQVSHPQLSLLMQE